MSWSSGSLSPFAFCEISCSVWVCCAESTPSLLYGCSCSLNQKFLSSTAISITPHFVKIRIWKFGKLQMLKLQFTVILSTLIQHIASSSVFFVTTTVPKLEELLDQSLRETYTSKTWALSWDEILESVGTFLRKITSKVRNNFDKCVTVFFNF